MGMTVKNKLNSHNEWDPLKEVIVGTAKNTVGTLSWLKPGPIDRSVLDEAKDLAIKACPSRVIEEVEEDLDGLANTLKSLGIVVHRPNVHDLSEFYGTPNWQSNGNNCYNARDLNLVVGNSLIESPSMIHSRYYETSCYYDIWYEYFEYD